MVAQYRCSSEAGQPVYQGIKPAPAIIQTPKLKEAVMRSLSILAAATTALVATIPFAEVAAAEAAPAVVVGYADLDLGTPRGVAILDRRILGAIATACGSASDVDPAGRNRVRACHRTTAAEVRVQRERVLAAAARSGSTRLASSR
jgi:UrcA family protein